MRKSLMFCGLLTVLTACNSVYLKPNTLDSGATMYADRGGYSMRRSIKERMKQRGYKIIVGKASTNEDVNDGTHSVEIETNIVPKNVTYIIKVSERSETFRPVWCVFNGFWWWNFNISIADNNTGEELMTWRGRGCANSSLRMLDRILDDMEM